MSRNIKQIIVLLGHSSELGHLHLIWTNYMLLNTTTNLYYCLAVKVKQSLYRIAGALRVPEEWVSQISRQPAREGGKAVSRTNRPPLSPSPTGKYSWYSFLLRGWVDPRAIMRPEGLRQWKISTTPSGIEPTNFRRVAWGLKQQHHNTLNISARVCHHEALHIYIYI